MLDLNKMVKPKIKSDYSKPTYIASLVIFQPTYILKWTYLPSKV
jgi:hypothetical protein